ncbi:MAG: hypothetical protein ABMA26_04270 [Limisphaerales bacterium]
MNWETILQIPAWTPLREVTVQRDLVLPGIYRVAADAYLVTQVYNREFEEGRPEAPFVTVAVWAESLSALKRCVDCDVSVQVATSGVKPPDALLFGTTGTYGELERQIAARERKISERATYSNTGVFVHKIIEIGHFTFCFLEPKIRTEEQVYAIKLRLA